MGAQGLPDRWFKATGNALNAARPLLNCLLNQLQTSRFIAEIAGPRREKDEAADMAAAAAVFAKAVLPARWSRATGNVLVAAWQLLNCLLNQALAGTFSAEIAIGKTEVNSLLKEPPIIRGLFVFL